MVEVDRYMELTRLLWQIHDRKITEFKIELNRGERGDHLSSAVQTFANDKNLRLESKKRKHIFAVWSV